jgi:hypothetical protein
MGKTFRNSKSSFDDDYDGYRDNVKSKRKKQKNLRKVKMNKHNYENFIDDNEDDYTHRMYYR